MSKQTSLRIYRWLCLLLVSIMVLGACVPAATEEATTAAQPSATLPPPTPAPPTATPMPLPEPQLASRQPAPGEEQPLDAPIVLTFDEPMDRASVEAAFAISPTVEGAFDWADDRTLSFRPAGPLERGNYYQVTVAATAANNEGLSLVEPLAFGFQTSGFLHVSQVMPAQATVDLDPGATVTVVFDRPVVPLTSIGQQAGLPDPLTFVPPVAGEGEWLNTSIYLFRPDGGFLPATHYKARVAGGLSDTTGGVLEDDYTWEFTTIRPAVLSWRPKDGFPYVGPTDVISVTFNQPMDHPSVEAAFGLMAQDQPVSGTFRWSGGEKPSSPETMVFVPDRPLPRGTDFDARVAADARARAGEVGLAGVQAWSFATVKEPALLRTFPADGRTGIDPGTSVTFVFAGPMDRKGFMEHLTILPEATKVYTSWAESDTEVEVSFDQEPVSDYTLRVDAGAPDRYGALLGKAGIVRFSTGDLPPYAALNYPTEIGVYSAYTDTVVYATHRNVSRIELDVYQVDLATFMRLQGDWEARNAFRPAAEDLVRSWTVELDTPRNKAGRQPVYLDGEDGPALPPGIYYLQMAAPEIEAKDKNYQPWRWTFIKTRLNLALKQTQTEALVWATDLASGRPEAALAVSLYKRQGKEVTEGTTGSNGLFQAGDLALDDLWSELFAVSGAPGDEGFAIAFNGWDSGISPWDFDVESEFWANKYQGYLYTDRPIYRPGQTVYFKGILRDDDDAHYSIPAGLETLEVRLSDPQGKEIYKEKLALSDMGSLFDQLALDAEAPLGSYWLQAQDTDREIYVGTSFTVAEYKKPEYQVEVTADKLAYLGGDTIHATAEATYYFGGPVAGAKVRWSVLSSNHFFSYTCPQGGSCPWYSWTDYEWGSEDLERDYGGYGELIAEGDAVTDAQGRVTFPVPADISKETLSQLFTVEASVTDLTGQVVSSRTGAIVHKGEFYVGIAPRQNLAQVGEEAPVELLTVDWDGRPVAGVPLTLVFMEHEWFSVQRQAEDGGFYWDWTTRDTPVLTTTVTTGRDGRATATFVPKKAGSYRVRALARDGYENQVRSSTYLWVWGGDAYVSWRQESNNRITLIADKPEYEVGDTAEILVASPYSGTVQMMYTVERGHLMDADVRQVSTNSYVLKVPILEEMVPNVFVSVLLVQGSEQAPGGLATFKMGLVKLPVSLESKRLTIALTPDKDMAAGEHYAPRQTATYDVLVTDSAGKPVEAELSLRLADLAVLALADEPGYTLEETFWRNRGLGVRTSLPLAVSMEAYNREVRAAAKGGGGGDEGGLVRSNFADTTFWDPVVRTGKDGKAQVEATLADNLTTWRMQARGITADTRVGQVNVDIVSTLDLLVRPVLPRFFVVNDEAEIATVVHNNTGEPLQAEVSITAEGLAVDGATTQPVSIAAGEQAKVSWPVKVLPGQEVKVRMWAKAGDLYDGREDTLPVYPYSTPEVVATAGQPGTRQEIVQLPRAFDPAQGALTLHVDGSLTASTQEALTYLEEYPYECVEQTVSRFLPNVATWQALDEMGLERPALRQKLAQLVGSGLQRLYNEQHYDGGWGWWAADKSNAYLTAYILQGMLEAKKAGFTVDEDVLARAAGFLSDNLPSVGKLKSQWEANRLAYQLYVIAEHSAATEATQGGSLGLAIGLYDRRTLLSRYGEAYLAVALSLLEPEEPQRVQTLLSDLAGSAVVSATGTHWEEAAPDYWNMNTDIRTTAIVLWAMARLEPEGALLPNVVRWLMAVREDGHWETTQATAWSLLSLVEYMRASGELKGDFSWELYLNGVETARGDIEQATIDATHTIEVEIGRLLVDQGNRLVVERLAPHSGQSGEGMLYYSASLKYYLPAEQVKALNRGITVARQYSPSDAPGAYVDRAQVGDVIKVKLTIIAPTDLYYVVVEDPLPAGCEGVDVGLKTTSVVGDAPELQNLSAKDQERYYGWYGYGWWWFSTSEMRDEKVVLFAEYLPRGTYEYTYLMRAGVPGKFQVSPSIAYQMYFPETFGRSDGGKFTVASADQ
ncbi:MAG TPA: Ig-like domain-containing protein [Anaerolineae bacterium]|nr:Ig-like domain-containing protein [Anaerolineae bacterium]